MTQTLPNARHSLGITHCQIMRALSAALSARASGGEGGGEKKKQKTGPVHSLVGRQINKTASKTNRWRASFIPLEWGLLTGVPLSVEWRGAPALDWGAEYPLTHTHTPPSQLLGPPVQPEEVRSSWIGPKLTIAGLRSDARLTATVGKKRESEGTIFITPEPSSLIVSEISLSSDRSK